MRSFSSAFLACSPLPFVCTWTCVAPFLFAHASFSWSPSRWLRLIVCPAACPTTRARFFGKYVVARHFSEFRSCRVHLVCILSSRLSCPCAFFSFRHLYFPPDNNVHSAAEGFKKTLLACPVSKTNKAHLLSVVAETIDRRKRY